MNRSLLLNHQARGAYLAWKSHFGDDPPDWDNLSGKEKNAWIDAVKTATGIVNVADKPESLLSAAIDATKRGTRVNAIALTNMETALLWLKHGEN